MIDASDKIFPEFAKPIEFARLMGMALPMSKPIVFISSPLELQVVDDWKEKRKEEERVTKSPFTAKPNLKYWCAGAEGKGVVKSFPNMRWNAFAHFYPVLDQVSASSLGLIKADIQNALEAVQISSTFTDLRARRRNAVTDFRTCPSGDKPRNYLRLQSLHDTAALLQRSYPSCVIHTFLKGQRLSGRYNEIRNNPGNHILKGYGKVFSGANCMKDFFDTMDSLSQIKGFMKNGKPSKATQPKPFASNGPITGSWTELNVDTGDIKINPTFSPAVEISATIKPAPDTAIRVLIDGCVLDGRVRDLLDFVDRFEGDIEMSRVPEVVKELAEGHDGKTRLRKWNEIMDRKKPRPIVENDVLASSLPTEYGDNTLPRTAENHLQGDLAIRVQTGRLIEALKTRSNGKRLIVLFITQDYGCAELMKAIKVNGAIFITLRVDADEKGKMFLDIVYNMIRAYLA